MQVRISSSPWSPSSPSESVGHGCFVAFIQCLSCNTKIGVPWLPKILLQYLRQHGTPIFGCQECCQAAPKHCEKLGVNHKAQTCLGCPSKCITHTPTLEHEKRTYTHRTYCMHTCLPSLEQRISKTRHGNIYSVASTHTGLNIFPGPSGFSIARVEEGNSVGNSRGIRGNSMVVSGNSMDLVSAWSYKS